MSACATAVWAAGLSGAALLCARTHASEADDVLFRNPTFEDLANVTVTSVTRAPLPQFVAPAPVYTMHAEDLRTSGATNIPDALRLTPGMQASQFDARTWAIAARGFGSLFVDKLLVLVDGRSVYTPLWSGVYWEQYERLDPDLDRIEVVRGSAGAAWGANAVNGVVNILSRSAHDTQGLALELGAGTEERAFGSVRYGGEAGADAHYRVYADYKERDDTELRDGGATGDAWHMARGGARYDRQAGGSRLMLKGEVYSGTFDEPAPVPAPTPPYFAAARPGSTSGRYVQADWSQSMSDRSELSVDAWFESYERRLRPSNEESRTFNVDLQHRTSLDRHTLTAQLGYRRVDHEGIPDFTFALSPAERSLDVWNAFVQDEIALTPRVSLTAGVRFEHNDFVDWEPQPNVRLSWRVRDNQTFWAAVGRAVRTPSISNVGGLVTLDVAPPGAFGAGAPPTIQQVIGNPDVQSEKVTASELGWRVRWADTAMLAISTFYNDYDQLITYAAQALDTTTLAPAFWRLPFKPVNAGSGRSYGAELSALWLPTPQLRLDAEFSALDLQLLPANDPLALQLSGSTPRRQASLRASYDFAPNWRLGAVLRYASKLDSLEVDAYTEADVRLAWLSENGLEIAVVGRDLLNERHAEFRSTTYRVDSYVGRSAFVTVAWRP